MSLPLKGILRLAANRRTWLLERADGKGILQVPRRELSASLGDLDPKVHDGLEVEFDLVGGQPRRIRRPGETWSEPGPAPERASARPRLARADQAEPPPAGPLPGEFHNPYNFIPAPPRNTTDPDLGDCGAAGPAAHGRYLEGRWSGQLRVRMEVKTPLLLLDAARATTDEHGHQTYPVRLGPNGRPYVPSSSIKGMLRAAYEAVTNSRFGVFARHDRPLRYRMDPSEGLGMVPARIEDVAGTLKIRLMPGPEGVRSIGPDGQPVAVGGARTMYAAWLPRYEKYGPRSSPSDDKGESIQALRYQDDSLPAHGEPVWVQVTRVRHRRRPFDFLRVTQIDRRQVGGPIRTGWCAGWVCVTGPNIMPKHSERVFLECSNDPHLPLTEELSRHWQQLIEDYQMLHQSDIEERRQNGQSPSTYLGHDPGQTGWSRHIWNAGSLRLQDGTLCYARVENQGGRLRIHALYPVPISREIFEASPEQLLDPSLHPATSLAELSPADRVFGWVNQRGRGAYRGNLRIGPVHCEDQDAVVDFGCPGLPLAILGQPKPQQARFYVARDRSGRAQDRGLTKREAGYREGKGLRGRKVYPHHAGLPAGYWNNPLEDRTRRATAGRFQEYRRPSAPDGEEQRDNQNRSVQGWVRPGTRFRFDVLVTNLSKVELGALLWLLSLPEGRLHRLGGGKPLGFGSVRLGVEELDLRTGEGWRQYYTSLEETAGLPEHCLHTLGDADACVRSFKEAVGRAYGNGQFESVPFIRAFLRTGGGFDDGRPIHYPRARPNGWQGPVPPHPEGRAYEWFVSNERIEQRRPRHAYALPDLESDQGLPILPQPRVER